jgi:hypothetical protein
MNYQLCCISRYYLIVANEAISYQWYLVGIYKIKLALLVCAAEVAVEKSPHHTQHAAERAGLQKQLAEANYKLVG